MTTAEEFALLLRALALYGLDDLNFTHCSAQTPALRAEGQIMISSRDEVPFWAYGAHNVARAPSADPLGAEPNPQWLFNKSIHDALGERAAVIIHTHSVLAIANGWRDFDPVSQASLQFNDDFVGHVNYRSLRGTEADADSCLLAFGETRMAVLIEGHGTLSLGRSFGEAFEIAYNLERALRINLLARQFPHAPIEGLEARLGREAWKKNGRLLGQGSWPALRHYLKATPPSPVTRTCA